MIDRMFVYRDNSGKDYPVCSDTEAVSYTDFKTPITPLFTEFNVSLIWGGEYTLAQAIAKVSESIDPSRKVPGIRISFTNSKGNYECWEYYNNKVEFNTETSWRKSDSSALLELQEKVFPLSVTLSSNKSLLGVGDDGSVKLTWSVSRKDLIITTQSSLILNEEPVQGTFKDIKVDTTVSRDETYRLTATYQGLTKSTTKTIKVSDYSYFGIVSEAPSNLNSLSKVLVGGKSWSKSGINLVNQKTCYAYPMVWGELTSIKDSNNFDYLGSYTKTELSNDKGVKYIVYTLTSPTTISNFKQVWQ